MADEADAWLAATAPPVAPAVKAPAAPDPVDQWLAATTPKPIAAPAPAPTFRHGPNFDPGQDVPGEADQALHQKVLTAGGAGVTVGQPQTADQMAAGQAKAARRLREDEIANDPLAQQIVAGVLGGAAGKLVGPIASRLGPVIGRSVTGATEGAVSSKEAGGSALAGGVVGGALGAVGGIVEGAPGRVRARIVKNVAQGEGDAPAATARVARKVADKAGEEGEELGPMLDENPGLEHTLSATAARHPAKGLSAVQDALDRYDAESTPVYKAITDAGGVKLTDLVSKLNATRDRLGRSVAGDAVAKERDALIKRYSEGFEGPKAATITGEELRKLRNEIGQAAFAGDPTASVALKTVVKRNLYGAVRDLTEEQAKQIEGLSPAINVDRFRANNRAVSQLIPIKEALEQRALKEKAGESPVLRMLKDKAVDAVAGGSLAPLAYMHGGLKEAIPALVLPGAARIAARAGRHVDYGISRLSAHVGEPTALAEAVGARVKDAASDAITPEDAVRAGGVGAAAKDTAGGRMLNGVRWFGRPATEAERTEAGLPASLHHAIETNDPNLGHAALVGEVLAR